MGRFGIKRNEIHDGKRINLAIVDEEKINWILAVPLILLIVLCAVFFSKIFVIDRLQQVSVENRKVEQMTETLEALYNEIDSEGEVTGRYHHYTLSGMTEEEQHRRPRQDIFQLVREMMTLVGAVESFRVSGNSLSVSVSAPDLKTISNMVRRLEENPYVDTISVAMAQTDSLTRQERLSGFDYVSAQITIYLRGRGLENVESGG